MKPNKLQTIIYITTVAIFFAGLATVFFLSRSREAGSTSTFTVSKGSLSNLSGQSLDKFSTNSQVWVVGNALIESREGKVALLEKQQAGFLENEGLTSFAPSDLAYFEIKQPSYLKLGDRQIKITKAEFIVETKINTIHVLSGEVDTAKANQSFILGSTPKTTDRSYFSSNTQIAQIIQFLKTTNSLPAALTDLDPPQIVLPTMPKLANSEIFQLAGQTERGTELKINNTPTDVEADGHFSTKINLKSGANVIEVEAIDDWGNTEKVVINISYLAQKPLLENVTEQSDCTVSNEPSQLLCKINSYRTGRGLNKFAYSKQFSQAALDFSYQQLIGEPQSLSSILLKLKLGSGEIVQIIGDDSSLILEKLLTEHKDFMDGDLKQIGIAIIGSQYSFIFGS